MNRFVASISLPVALAIAGCTHSHEKPAMTSTGDSTSISSTDAPKTSATDLHNTVCPVSGDKVESSRLTQTYDGKVYHLCCNDCVKPFQKDPGKYAKAIADNPAKYGVTPQKSQ